MFTMVLEWFFQGIDLEVVKYLRLRASVSGKIRIFANIFSAKFDTSKRNLSAPGNLS